MRKLFVLFTLLFFVFQTDTFAGIVILDGATTTGASSGLKFPEHLPVNKHMLSIDYTDENDSITAMTVVFEWTISPPEIVDNAAIWHKLVTYELTADDLTDKQAYIQGINTTANRVRANITVLTGADGTDEINVVYAIGESYPENIYKLVERIFAYQ